MCKYIISRKFENNVAYKLLANKLYIYIYVYVCVCVCVCVCVKATGLYITYKRWYDIKYNQTMMIQNKSIWSIDSFMTVYTTPRQSASVSCNSKGLIGWLVYFMARQHLLGYIMQPFLCMFLYSFKYSDLIPNIVQMSGAAKYTDCISAEGWDPHPKRVP